MAYRFNGTDPFLRTSPGAVVGYAIGQAASSCFALLKLNASGAWQGVYTMDDGTSLWHDLLEFTNASKLTSYTGGGSAPVSTATFTDTTNFMIVGYTWDGTTTAGAFTWWWKIGAGAWTSQTATVALGFGTAVGSGFRNVIGNEPGLGDDANYDMVCIGVHKSKLASGTLQTLDMSSIASWDAVFTGSSAWLLGFDGIGTRADRTGNGGNELSRSAGITLVSDPAGWSWSSGGATVTAVPADGTGDILAPTVTASAAVAAPPADATGDIPGSFPISSGLDAVPADATGTMPAPAISGSADGTVTAVPADATGDVATPAIAADAAVAAVAADATGDAVAPAVVADSAVTAAPTDGTGAMARPTVTGAASLTPEPDTPTSLTLDAHAANLELDAHRMTLSLDAHRGTLELDAHAVALTLDAHALALSLDA